ncbi:bifunctional Gfo/Idh/MocA family oxidoreductase/class I SAM-dependent methyltransferase [Sporomusa sp. KB1]|jgi:thiazolinyl imide reductase|uniref:bifunctional Gfo/Idh/MocA family oxidoreductase/class I SAM-dependent methyltransferase n=1 Tax=Sporomusa sp. KB1 TaxID=943346 RepID=UPI0011A401AC|nr:bifunctional Gfo/Idh/MocA family oxidoreductase/class I SAM-dependent methyltransferase [Sporomusa sp. KB1]TWH46115.1 thiazolinyl imide reductase [Sporomusa sp. KB1]
MTGGKLRTVVCGSTFGQFYLAALHMLPEQFEVAGLLARGSERSQQCAKHYGIKLYTEARQLPNDIDLACVVLRSGVLGGKGTELSLNFLEQGIHVIQEQPVHHKDMMTCFSAAHRNNAVFRTGDLYVHLPAVRRFIVCAKALLERQEALYIDAAFASQVSYPMMHILLEALPSIRIWKTGAVSRDGGPFHVLTGRLGQIPAILRVHNEVDPDDPDNYLHLLHRIAIGCEGGSLSLADTHGPVLWQPRLHIPENLNTLSELAGANIEYMLENSIATLGPSSSSNYRDILTQQWPQAIARDLSSMREMIRESSGQVMRAQQELLCSRQWQEMTAALGYPVLRPGCSHQPLPVSILEEAAGKIQDDNGSYNAADYCGASELSTCTEYADSELAGISSDDVILFVRKLEAAVFSSMVYTFQLQGILTNREREYSLTEILSVSNTAPRHQYLIRRWLALLTERGWLQHRGDNYYGADVVSKQMLGQRWQAAREIWDSRLGPPLTMDYLIRNVEQLPQLLSGQQQPTLLLFPEGKIDYASACYRDVMARYLNKTLAEAVIRIGLAKKPAVDAVKDELLHIVEIGAGTGATTDEVVRRLKTSAENGKTEYLFTDVSNYFLTAASKRFKDCPWMRFQIVDIDKDFIQQGLKAESVDIIIAAGVLDNSFDIDKTVNGLMRILKPGGWMLITEPVHDLPETLISQAFMMTHQVESGERIKSIFMSVRQWQDVFRKADVAEVLTFPGEEHPLAPLGQKLFAARKNRRKLAQALVDDLPQVVEGEV